MPPLKPEDREALTACAQRLVRTPSISGQEARVAALVAEELQRVGFDEVRVDALGNVLGRMGSPGGRKLLWNAHMDTVAMGEREGWGARDPFGGEIEQGVLYGRGACDMKGGLAAMLYGAKAWRDNGGPRQGALYLAAVVQEEPCEGAAMRHIVEQEGLRPDWVVLGEATNLQIARAQRGRIEFQVRVQGRSSHASAPERGVNAAYEAARLIVGLELLGPQLGQDPFLGRGTIAVTGIHAEAASHNVIPDLCTLTIDRRLTVGETETKAITELRRVLIREGIKATVDVPTYCAASYTGLTIATPQAYPYWLTPETEPLALAGVRAVETELGYTPRLGKWDFSTDGVYTMGAAGIPTIGFGPGEERYAHTAEEQVRLADLEAAARVYAALARIMLS